MEVTVARSALETAQFGANFTARARSNHQASTSHSSQSLSPVQHLSASDSKYIGKRFPYENASHKRIENMSCCTGLRPDCVRLHLSAGSSRHERLGFDEVLSPQKHHFVSKLERRKILGRPEKVLSGRDPRQRLNVQASAATGETAPGGNAGAFSKKSVLPVEVELNWQPPKWAWRALSAALIAGQVASRIIKGKIHWKNTLEQLAEVGPGSLGVCLLTASFVGMVFTIQFVREFARLGLTRSVGGVLALALSRELTPVVTAIILAGRVGSAFAAELGTMQVSEQTDTLRVLRTDPVDYLITPRVIACSIAMPCLTVFCFTVGMAASVLLADGVYNVSSNIILDSAARALSRWDLISTLIKSTIFGVIISVISCAWGVTTNGGAKGVGESTTSAVVISLVVIFIADFVLSFLFFQGAGDSLKAALG